MEPYGFTVGDTDTLEIKFTDSYTGEGIPNVTVDIYTEFIDWEMIVGIMNVLFRLKQTPLG